MSAIYHVLYNWALWQQTVTCPKSACNRVLPNAMYECLVSCTFHPCELFNGYSLLGRKAASIRLNTTFRGLAPSPSSGKTVLPEDGNGASPRNVVFKRTDAAVRPRRLY
jgi:hypothetical protein